MMECIDRFSRHATWRQLLVLNHNPHEPRNCQSKNTDVRIGNVDTHLVLLRSKVIPPRFLQEGAQDSVVARHDTILTVSNYVDEKKITEKCT
jgi:hypothetical protein